MACVEAEKLQVKVLRFYQEKGDVDYGSCLWARFYFDTKNYTLIIESDCGSCVYTWVPTPKSESFMRLMSRINDDYLIEKISRRTVVNSERTWKNVKETLEEILDGKEPDFDWEDIENVCYYGETDVYSALVDALKHTNANNDYFDDYELYNCIEMTYPYNAQKICKVFKEFIQPIRAAMCHIAKRKQGGRREYAKNKFCKKA